MNTKPQKSFDKALEAYRCVSFITTSRKFLNERERKP